MGLFLGYNMSPDEGKEEYEETQAELKKYEDDVSFRFSLFALLRLLFLCLRLSI